MKVVFLEDVPNVAETGEMKEVADGYARNFLLPKKLAVLADSKAAHLVEAQLKKKARFQAETEAEMRELARQLEGQEVVLKARAGAKDRLYGSITNADIAEELEKSAGVVVDKRKIELDEPIHELGIYEIGIRLTKDIIPKVKLTVAGEEEGEGKEKKEGKAEKTGSKEKKESKAEKTGSKEKKGSKAEKTGSKEKKGSRAKKTVKAKEKEEETGEEGKEKEEEKEETG
ncbi:MAG TPA: 50S ribosomal protein L9 [Dehalococcoidales bacterium]|nr:50S ribosomal protein L9 [Dehalococcoidales bacterium]